MTNRLMDTDSLMITRGKGKLGRIDKGKKSQIHGDQRKFNFEW